MLLQSKVQHAACAIIKATKRTIQTKKSAVKDDESYEERKRLLGDCNLVMEKHKCTEKTHAKATRTETETK